MGDHDRRSRRRARDRRVQSGIGRTSRRDGSSLSRLAGHHGRSTEDRELRQGISFRSRTRRSRVLEEPSRALRHYCKVMFMKQLFSPALVFAMLGYVAVPAYAADKEVRQMMADIRMLQEQSQELSNLLGQLTEALKAVNSRIDQQTEAGRKSSADQKVAIDAVSGDLRVVRERMDDNGVRLGSLTQEVDALRQTVMQINLPPQSSLSLPETPVAPDAAAGAGVPPPGAAPPPAGPPAASRTPAIAGGLSPKAAYEQAMADYYIAQYDLAIAGLEAYIRAFPRSEQADEAQVNIGNSYFQQGKYDKALEAYDLAIRTYAKGNATAEAYLKKGMSLSSLRRPDEARTALEFVTTNFPDSFEATLARQQLAKLPTPVPAGAARRP